MLKLDELFPFQRSGNYYNLSFFNSSDLGLRLKKYFFFLQVLVNILLLGFRSVEPYIFADPDPGSQNLADPTNPDPLGPMVQVNSFWLNFTERIKDS